MLSFNRFAAVMALGLSSSAFAAFTDIVVIDVSIDPASNGYRRLIGQSAFLSQRTNSGTTGGQLDNVTSFDSETSPYQIAFAEVFPQANLEEYLTFGYFGVVQTYEFVDDGFGGQVEELVDTSIVVAGRFADFGVDSIFADFFSQFTEAELLAALTGGFDTPEFFSALDTVANDPRMAGDIALVEANFDPDFGGYIGTTVRGGSPLALYAFTGGDAGDGAVEIGFLESGVTRQFVPTPGAAGLLALGGLVAGRRRR